jgi:predicted nuclease of restriction endonuclease-like (RecB) superfamily
MDISSKYPGKKRNIGFFDNLSNDLCLGIKNPVGLSPANLRYAFRFFELYSYLQQLAEDNGVADLMKIPWGHHIVIIGKSKGDRNKALFYVRKTIENGWSRTDLQVAINEGLYEKTGKAVTNFSDTLPAPDGYLAKELIKNEYSFALTETVDENNERNIEKALVRNITRTLTELGGGFAYVGHQVRVNVGGEDFWPDLIFYHLKSRRYLVIELKAVNFKPEHIGQLGFYMVAVDRQLKNEWDAPTVGLVLCRDGNKTVIEYALSVTDKPMGVARYRLTQKTPKELSSMKRAVAKLGSVVDATIADAEQYITATKEGEAK